MKSKLINSLLFAFITTLTIYSLSKSNIYKKININLTKYFRHLSDKDIEEYTDEFCDKASDDLNVKYSKTPPGYNYSVPEGNEIIKEFINNNFKLEGSESVKDILIKYSKANNGYIFIFILLCLLIVLWIPYIICVCCRCCCCIPDSCGKNSRLLLYISIGLIAIVAIFCIIGYTKNSGIFEGIYGIGCSILKIEDHLARGDDYQVKPYWIGVSGINEKFDSAINDIKTMVNEAQNLSNDLNNIDTQKLTTDLEEDYDSKKNAEVSSPIFGESRFTPEYITKYGPVADESSVLGAINKEYSLIVNNSMDLINQVLGVINISDAQFNSLTSGINSVTDYLTKTLDDVESQIEDILDDYGDYLDMADSCFRKSMNTLFTLNVVLAIAITVSLVFLLCCSKGKFLLGLAWFFIFFFMLCSLLLGVTFGIASNLSRDVAFGIDYFIKNVKKLNIEQLPEELKGTIDICLNGDGAIENSELVDIKSMENPEL